MRRKQRADVQTQMPMAPAPHSTNLKCDLCLPTAPALPLEQSETSVGPRFLGNSQTSYCLSFVNYVGCRCVKHKSGPTRNEGPTARLYRQHDPLKARWMPHGPNSRRKPQPMTADGQMTAAQAATLKRLAQAAYELDAFKPPLRNTQITSIDMRNDADQCVRRADTIAPTERCIGPTGQRLTRSRRRIACPLWVKSRHSAVPASCPLCP